MIIVLHSTLHHAVVNWSTQDWRGKERGGERGRRVRGGERGEKREGRKERGEEREGRRERGEEREGY